jgi:hypothetical protein
MNASKMDLSQVAHRLGIVLEITQKRSLGWQAYQKLQVTDETGVATLQPYTPEAAAILEKAHQWDEEDHHIIHHLAIAYHSLAWDLEQQDPAQALPVWEKAIYYWKKLQNCAAFWQELCIKGRALGNGFNEETIYRYRKNLMRPLLEIHVRFILHYYESQKVHQATGHIHLIRKAQISPADRKHFEKLVYDAMTSTVPNMVSKGHFLYALAILDDFLALYPSYPLALQSCLEIAKQQLEQLSPASQWTTILQLDTRITKKWHRLNKAEHLQRYPLAQSAMVALAETLAKKHLAKANSLRKLRTPKNGTTQQTEKLECNEYKGYKYAIQWLEKAENLSPDTFDMKTELYNALLLRADFVTLFCLNAGENEAVFQLLEQALSDCQQAMNVVPDKAPPRELAAKIHQIKVEYRLRYLPDGLNDKEFAAHLKNVEADLESAIQFNPGNQSLKEMLNSIRETLGE